MFWNKESNTSLKTNFHYGQNFNPWFGLYNPNFGLYNPWFGLYNPKFSMEFVSNTKNVLSKREQIYYRKDFYFIGRF